MDAEERDIFSYLKSWGSEFVGAAEICRRAGNKRQFHRNPEWAIPKLETMLERGILEKDAHGRFRIRPLPRTKKGGRWVSPHIAGILREKGMGLDSHGSEIGNIEDYEHL